MSLQIQAGLALRAVPDFSWIWQLLARRLGEGRLAAEPRAARRIIQGCHRLPLALAIVAARAGPYGGPARQVSRRAVQTSVVRCGRKVGLAASSRDAYVLARDALMLLLDESGGRA